MNPESPIDVEYATAVYPPIATAGVVHDLGNLIQIASSAISIVARTPEMPANHYGPMLHRARISLEHAGALIRQTMSLTRDRRTGDDCSNIITCLNDVMALVDMDASKLVFDVGVEPGLPEVRCNPSALCSALLNLVLNARDAITGSGVIAIRARAILRGNLMVGAELTVADDGLGMSADTIACAFDPFFTTKCGGLGGVGLSMVERFVREAGGEISIASEPGVGTAVTLQLPASAWIINEG